MYENSIVYRKNIRKQKTSHGILMQSLGRGRYMNGIHWNMDDGSIVDWHCHPSEQFGYVIKGGLKIYYNNGIEKEAYEIHQGDCYFIPPNVMHKFIAVGDTEAIDIFNPIKNDLSKEIQTL